MANQRLKAMILQVVDQQLAEENPPIVGETMRRLLAEGNTKTQAREKIGAALLEELYFMLKDKKPYDDARYIEILTRIR